MKRANINIYNQPYEEGFEGMEDKQYDWAIVDPPYFNGPQMLGYFGANISSVGVVRNGYKKTACWEVPGQEYFEQLFRVSKNQIIWGINHFDVLPGSGRIIWDKCNGKSSFSDCEIAYCSSHDSVRLFRYMWNGMMQGKDIVQGHIQQGNKKLNERRIHPTQKPVLLYKWLLHNYIKDGDKILDTHGGSLSIALACWDFGIDLDVYEKDKHHYSNGIKRFNAHTSQRQFANINI